MEDITGEFYYYGITEYNFISRNGCYGSYNTSIIKNITWNNARSLQTEHQDETRLKLQWKP
jgi:hypothetical protein